VTYADDETPVQATRYRCFVPMRVDAQHKLEHRSTDDGEIDCALRL